MARGRAKNGQRKRGDPDIIVTEKAVRGKEDFSTFDTPVDEELDFISKLPSETLDQVLSYLVLDHDPERGVKARAHGTGYKHPPHVLLSLACMSRLFRAHVESFSRRELLRNKDDYRHVTQSEIDAKCRRSARLQAKPPVDTRCYRAELVQHLQTYCIECNDLTNCRAQMASGVACHLSCEDAIFAATIQLTEALREYDLRDCMLLKTRRPGPRSKHKDLPAITYGSYIAGLGYPLGVCISYRFYVKDVEMIARIVHGDDLEGHMEEKLRRLAERKDKRLRQLHMDLKIRYHMDALNDPAQAGQYLRHQNSLAKYQDPAWGGDWRDGIVTRTGYGDYDDIHDRISKIAPRKVCRRCRYTPYGCCYYQ
ncbi:hypothetical protein LTR53_010580 [Teratosphaeriaceae sp. CCFEE 6253]|nr:hypothetical protein LTR53_010580 [Teratosphaeriaceae sp. CCFEE 6253]